MSLFFRHTKHIANRLFIQLQHDSLNFKTSRLIIQQGRKFSDSESFNQCSSIDSDCIIFQVPTRQLSSETVSSPESSKGLPKIYTRTGDRGTSGTFTGERRRKTDPLFEALGTIDELSCSIGFARAAIEAECNSLSTSNESVKRSLPDFREKLLNIQCHLQDASSVIATPSESARNAHLKRTRFDWAARTTELEKWIDSMSESLPPLRNFILPGGGMAAASIHLARSVCRRAERVVWAAIGAGGEATGEDARAMAVYVNRLSDLLFTLARATAAKLGRSDDVYRPQPDTR